MENFTWEIRVAAAGPDEAIAYARKHRFELGGAVSFDREYDRVSALEHVLGAIGADVATGLLKRARQRGLEVESAEAVVKTRLGNPLVFLDVQGEHGDPGLEFVSVRVYLVTSCEPAVVEGVWRETLEHSPLVRTFRKALDLQLSIRTMP